MFRYVVLGLLSDDVPRHGYALMKAYRARVGVKLNTGSFYRELQRLVAAGLVRNVARTTDADRRQAPYQITEAGLATFNAWLADPEVGGIGVSQEDQLSARVMFLGDVPSDAGRRVIAHWQDDLWMRTKLLERAHVAAQAAGVDPQTFPILPMLVARRLRHVTADLEFLEELRQAYEGWLAAQPARGANATDGTPSGKRVLRKRSGDRAPE